MRTTVISLVLCWTLAGGAGPAQAQIEDVRVAASGDGIQLLLVGEHGGGALVVADPDGTVSRTELAAGTKPTYRRAGGLIDGLYTWELTLAPRLDPEELLRLQQARVQGVAVEDLPAGLISSGTFAILGGQLLDARLEPAPQEALPRGTPTTGGVIAAEDTVTDDLIVHNSICVGFDCVNGEDFGFDTIRLKENSLRIKFDDTSTLAGFPNRDWQLTANDSASGGANKFSIEDVSGGRVPFTLRAGAPSDSIFVDSSGRVGFKTATPSVELHSSDGDTPTLRLEQNGSSGFAPQSWDVAGNETSFFVRDVTGGSLLPFRIRPGAPSSSIDIAADGDVGIGTSSPGRKLDVVGDVKAGKTTGGTTSFFIENTGGTNASSWILRANSSNGAFTFTEAGANTVFRIFKGAAANTLDVTASGVNVVGTLSVGGTPLNVPDYVFDEDYPLLPIADQGQFMRSRRHLPSVPKESLGEDGRPRIDLVATQMGMLEELEKAHLYIQQLHGDLASAEQRIADLQQELLGVAQARADVARLQQELAGLRAEVAAIAVRSE